MRLCEGRVGFARGSENILPSYPVWILGMSRPVADDILAVLSEIRHRFQISDSSPDVTKLRRDSIHGVADQELAAARFVDHRSAKESIYDACSRRLGGIAIATFDQLVTDWLRGRPDALRAAVLAKATTEGQRQRIAELLGDPGFQPATPLAQDLESPPAERVKTTVSRVIRDSKLSNRVKALHGHECQICGYALILADGSRYAEGHHVQPLGTPHDGADVLGNILCLCPNHHAACAWGLLSLFSQNCATRLGTLWISDSSTTTTRKSTQGRDDARSDRHCASNQICPCIPRAQAVLGYAITRSSASRLTAKQSFEDESSQAELGNQGVGYALRRTSRQDEFLVPRRGVAPG